MDSYRVTVEVITHNDRFTVEHTVVTRTAMAAGLAVHHQYRFAVWVYVVSIVEEN